MVQQQPRARQYVLKRGRKVRHLKPQRRYRARLARSRLRLAVDRAMCVDTRPSRSAPCETNSCRGLRRSHWRSRSGKTSQVTHVAVSSRPQRVYRTDLSQIGVVVALAERRGGRPLRRNAEQHPQEVESSCEVVPKKTGRAVKEAAPRSLTYYGSSAGPQRLGLLARLHEGTWQGARSLRYFWILKMAMVFVRPSIGVR